MQTLREKLFETSHFLIGVELPSTRASLYGNRLADANPLAKELVASPQIDWVSITDNTGGHPRLTPFALGRPIQDAGKEVVIHLTCKNLNRNGLQNEAWMLNGEGLYNILATTGDYPGAGGNGLAKPVFDIDSVGLISLLHRMNQSRAPAETRSQNENRLLEKTQFCIGAVTTNFKLRESELVPQYLKLGKKVECGAQFIINQIGFDSRKMSELRLYMDAHGMKKIPLIGNVRLLNPHTVRIFYEGKIPGVVVTQPLWELCQKQGQSADGGKAFFCELAAKQIAIYRGLGYRGVYLGGVENLSTIEKIFETERSFKPDDWKQFAREIRFSQSGEFFYYSKNPATGLANPDRENPRPLVSIRHVTKVYRLSKWSYKTLFVPGAALARWGAKICAGAKDPLQGPKPVRALERWSKAALFQCKDCGDCMLPEMAFLCPESQCPKNDRNGPCGGTREGRCEVDGSGDCVWVRAYERLKYEGTEQTLLQHAPVFQNHALQGTSAWANRWLGRDHAAEQQTTARPEPVASKPAP